LDAACDGARIWIEQDLVGIEAQALQGCVGPVHPVAIELPRPYVRRITMPNTVRALLHRDAVRLTRGVSAVVETQIDGGSVTREEGKVDALPVPEGAEPSRSARPYPHAFLRG